MFKAIYHTKLIQYHYVPIIYLIYLIKPPFCWLNPYVVIKLDKRILSHHVPIECHISLDVQIISTIVYGGFLI